MFRHGSLFSGIGGFDLAAQWMGWENVFQVEWDKWCQKVLAKNFPDSLRFGDIVEFNKMLKDGEITTDTGLLGQAFSEKQTAGIVECCETNVTHTKSGESRQSEAGNGRQDISRRSEETHEQLHIGRINILTGGFPCQPFSHAGKRKGTDDSRYLWPEMLTTIRILKPSFVVGENVAGLVSMENGKTLDGILSDLANEGYQTEQFIIPACGVGAWHRRDRIWIVAYTVNRTNRTDRGQGRETEGIPKLNREAGLSGEFSGTGSEVFSNTYNSRLQGMQKTGNNGSDREESIDEQFKGCSGGGEMWYSEPSVGRGFNGLPLWLHRHNIKGYGQTESYRRIEILRELWKTIPTQLLWQVVGGFDQIQKSEILFALVCEYEKRPNETRLLMESKEALEGFVRRLWMQGEITGSPFGSEDGKQLSGKHSDSLQTLSRLLAHNLQENWQISCWEDGVPRVATGIKNRVDRLKGLGNAIVPQVAYQIFKAIEETNLKWEN